MKKAYRLAVARAMAIPAWHGLGKMDKPVDTLILGDSVARVNLSSGQWHDMGLGDVINLGNSSVSGVEADVKMLKYYLMHFKPPERVVMVRHLGAYLDDAIMGKLINILEPAACFQLQYNGKWPRIPVMNDYGPVGLSADPGLVNTFVQMRPKWLVGPWKMADGNRESLHELARMCRDYRITLRVVMGPTCSLVAKEAEAMKAGWVQECDIADAWWVSDNRTYEPEQMQDPNHLAPEYAVEWSK